MARFSAIIPGAIFILAGFAVQAQPGQVLVPSRRAVMQQNQQPAVPPTMRPPQPNMQQPNQPVPQAPAPANTTQQPYHPGQPPTAPLKTAVAPPPTTPEVPPQVAYRDGLLTVQAANSSLGSVMTAIRNKTGIEFEGLENTQERVALSLGPAPAGEVLQSILAGLKYDYVAIGRPDDPGIVQRVILKSRMQGGGEVAASQQPQPHPAVVENGGDEDTPDETPNAEPQDTAVQPEPTSQAEPQQQPPQNQQPQNQQPQNQQPQNQQPKSPEQLLQELQDMRKQQQLQQEGAPPATPNQFPRKTPPVPR